MEIIKLNRGGIGKLAAKFKVSTRTVHDALKGKTQSGLARVLRRAAIEEGGTLYKSCESISEISTNSMIQTFGERVRIVVDLETGDANLYADGELRRSYNNLTMKELSDVQIEAQRIADNLK